MELIISRVIHNDATMGICRSKQLEPIIVNGLLIQNCTNSIHDSELTITPLDDKSVIRVDRNKRTINIIRGVRVGNVSQDTLFESGDARVISHYDYEL